MGVFPCFLAQFIWQGGELREGYFFRDSRDGNGHGFGIDEISSWTTIAEEFHEGFLTIWALIVVLTGAGFIEHAAELGSGGDFGGGMGDVKTIIWVDHSVHCLLSNSEMRKESFDGCLLG